MVGGVGKLARDAADGLMLGDEQAGQVLGKMASSRFIGEDVAELHEQLFHDLWDGNYRWHRILPRAWFVGVVQPNPTPARSLVQICKESPA